jgi:hypothetical protein
MADTTTDKLKVFISYSRKDSAAFADELVLGLEGRGFAPFLDRHDVKPGEPWEARLGGLVEQSDTVVFVISPESIKSERCVWEVDKARALETASAGDLQIRARRRNSRQTEQTAIRPLRHRARHDAAAAGVGRGLNVPTLPWFKEQLRRTWTLV